ncbi:MAG: sensor histidine kinase [Bacilli bacterium]|nr:sensor histidine kinase [Bacilli bacterium]
MKEKLTVRSRIALAMAVLMFLSTLVILLVIRGVSKAKIETENYQSILERQDQFDQALLDIINRVTYSYLSLFDDSSDLVELFQDSKSTLTERETYLNDLLLESEIDSDTFGEVMIYYEDDFYRGNFQNVLMSFPDISEVNLVASGSRDRLYFVSTVKDVVGKEYFVFGRQIVTMYPESDYFGIALFYLKADLVSNALLMLTTPMELDNGFSALVDASGEILFSVNPELSQNSEMYADLSLNNFVVKDTTVGKYIVVASPLERIYGTYYTFDYQVVSTLSYAILFQDIYQLNVYIIAIGSLSLILMVILVGIIAKGITKPLDKLITGLREFSRTKTKKREMTSDVRDEIYELEKTYDEMISQIVDLIDTNNLEMENKRKLELYALQMQINPHFLYNTLDTIAWMAKLKKEPEIERLVLALARFFRISLHKGDKYIKIEEEFDLIKNFVEIELARFPELFTVTYELDPDVAKVETLKLILQPIVENAIKHGFVGLDRVGHIFIRCFSKEQDIVFEVEDDGIGFDPTEDLFSEKRLLDGLGGYGLKNVDERIKLEYGREYGITVDSKKNQGTKVRITIRKAH